MKKTRGRCLLRSVPILLVLGMIACQQAAQGTGHVQHIENGLLTAIVIHGQTSPQRRLSEVIFSDRTFLNTFLNPRPF
jgi:hypothetical protein